MSEEFAGEHQHQYDERNVCEICGAKPPDSRRWTIWNTTVEWMVEGPRAGEWTGDGQPVVPCDDAAIERAAQAAVEFDEDGPSDPNMDWYRDLALAMFKAAGELP